LDSVLRQLGLLCVWNSKPVWNQTVSKYINLSLIENSDEIIVWKIFYTFLGRALWS
jgi:hypothetical protein